MYRKITLMQDVCQRAVKTGAATTTLLLRRRRTNHSRNAAVALAVSVGGGILSSIHHRYYYYSSDNNKTTTSTSLEESSSQNKNKDKDNQHKNESTTLDLTQELERAKQDLSGVLREWGVLQQEEEDVDKKQVEINEKKKDERNDRNNKTNDDDSPLSALKDHLESIFFSSEKTVESNESSHNNENKNKKKKTVTDNSSFSSSDSNDFLSSLVRDISSVMFNPSTERKEAAVQNLIETAHAHQQQSDDTTTAQDRNLTEVFALLRGSLSQMEQMLKANFAHIDITQLTLNSLYYFVEHTDERKNPSWKRRVHRFHPGIDYQQVADLNDALFLCELSYLDSVEQIQEKLVDYKDAVEMIYCETESFPGKPSHYVLLKKDQSVWSNELEVIIVVRGSKTLPDVITDCLLDAVDYRGGKAHAGILDSGKYLVEKHLGLLQKLRKSARKRKVKLSLIGHSLGAGAASIAGMEFHDVPDMDVEVIGFGCPALLSQNLSESTASYITTVINDWDLVPRMSGATVANALLDIMEYDWTDKARADTKQALQELQRVVPSVLSDSSCDYVLSLVDSSLEQYAKPSIKKATTERMTPVLFPPGTCIHFYHDGFGVTAAVAPCTFFNEIDVTRRMVDDHLTVTGYQQVFLDLMRQHKRDQNFSFDDLKR